MNRFNVNVLAEAKHEYTQQLVNLLYSHIYTGIKSIYEAAHLFCKKTNDKNTLKKFQLLLSQIPKWNQDKIDKEYNRVCSNSECDWIDELITAVFVSHTKVLSSIKNSKTSKAIDLDVPAGAYFLHKCYVESARNFWKKPYLMHNGFSNLEIQRNLADSEVLIQTSIKETVRKLLPVKYILKEYLGKDYMDDNYDDTEDVTSLISINTKTNLRKLVKYEIEQSLLKTDESEKNNDKQLLNRVIQTNEENSENKTDNQVTQPKDKKENSENKMDNHNQITQTNKDEKEKSETDLVNHQTKEENTEVDNVKEQNQTDDNILLINDLQVIDHATIEKPSQTQIGAATVDKITLNNEVKEKKWVPNVNDECLVWSESNGGWVKGTVHSIDKDIINMYYYGNDGDEYEKTANLNEDYNVLFKEKNASEEIKNIILNFNEKKDVDDDEFLNKTDGDVDNIENNEEENNEEENNEEENNEEENNEEENNEEENDNDDIKSQYSNHFSNYLEKLKNNKNGEIDANDLESITFFRDAAPF
jgi:hypothetical protein